MTSKTYLNVTQEAGSQVIFYGKCGKYLIGPESENWDAVLLIKHESVAKIMEFASNKGYLKGASRRNAGLADSRL